jgi:hypothetical protein
LNCKIRQLKLNKKNIIELFIVLIGITLVLSPIFSMDYLITLDGPNHLYNSKIFNRMVSGDTFSIEYFQMNPSVTPNYASFLLLSILLYFFNNVIALKVFHILLVASFIFGFYLWNQQKKLKNNLGLIVLVLPLIYSFVFFSGFYNFILGIILMFFILYFNEKNTKITFSKYIWLSLLLLILYLFHSIVFAFTGLALLIYELQNFFVLKSMPKLLLKKLTLLFITALPCVLLSLTFMNSRTSEITYLPFDVLINHFAKGFTLTSISFLGWLLKVIFLGALFVLSLFYLFKKLKTRFEQYDYLVITSFTLLLLYFIIPDSVGFASVFSVRIAYCFWLFLIAWIIRIPIKNYILKVGLYVLSLSFLSVQVYDNIHFWQPLNSATKQVLEANQFIKEESVVYPIFASNVWEHFHISNILGLEKNILILENSAARQDYFPLKYIEQYEKMIDENPTLNFHSSITIDYVIIIGKSSIDSEKDNKILKEIQNSGTLIFENELVTLWKQKQR